MQGARAAGLSGDETNGEPRLTTTEGGEHHVTVPRHRELRLGTLRSVIVAVATHLGETPDEVARKLFGG
jgi:hypothetical protein